MEFKFDKDIPYQLDAINSTINLFNGQSKEISKNLDFGEYGSIYNLFNINEKVILNNLKDIQKKNNLSCSEFLIGGYNFSVEMETGTGKTYVYLRTIFELNKRYGWKKFIIVVPSVAIREGVLNSLKITKFHFKKLYDNVAYNFYPYSSKEIIKIRQFSRNNNIEIMIITLDSFNKESNILNQKRDELRGEKGIDIIKSTRPILILDEPQNMESEKQKDAIDKLNPIFILRYSATHTNYYNRIYRLTPIDAYNLGIVKKIDVLPVVKVNDFNAVYIKCHEIIAEKEGLKVKLELNVKQKSGHNTKIFTLKKGADLFAKTKFEDYRGYIIKEINKSTEKIIFENGVEINSNQALGDNKKEIMTIQIRETIREHFEKQRKLKPLGIKVLSLFFIDKVSNYTDEDGFIRKTFIEEYNKLISSELSDFSDLNVADVQGSYFSIYKTDEKINEDKELIDLILKDKQKLVSFETKVQFIFSHSALKEGWDNPNVFNICTLNETQSQLKKRQEIGRGLRLPVNQNLERIKDLNESLTVIANEHYDKFAQNLQKEYEDEFGQGNSPKIKNRTELKKVKIKKGILDSNLFLDFWKHIGKKTTYKIMIDQKMLIENCITKLNSELNIGAVRIDTQKRRLILRDNNEIDYHTLKDSSEKLVTNFKIPNIIEELTLETNLTRKTIIEILSQLNLDIIFKNPREFIYQSSKIINRELIKAMIEHINYVNLNEIWDLSNFDEIINSYNTDIIPTERGLYDNVILDSNTEEQFVINLEKDNNIKLYMKLPNWFVIDTPVGPYNPDWAIIYESNNIKKLYFVSETKGSLNEFDLKGFEKIKIDCAKVHFNEINVNYEKVVNYSDLINYIKNLS
ncbi:DEAD/DEAH box helicase family protein [Methanoculleus sp.]|uniref:restriction endonuclease n=1 Tax=Methanoculleus sp. TaxID=90427 RepID=UPI0025D14C72|nr:DEAD/DEAH box helicase family protein [Methanoculleus sp.]MCK9319151.1 DEAD/DEAH box helicase family protein [Methanoculleus sp.]